MYRKLISLMRALYFVDDFNDNSLSSRWTTSFAYTTGTIVEQNQEIEATGSGQAAIRSTNSYDMTGKFTSVQMVSPPAANAHYNQEMFWCNNNGTNIAVAGANYYLADIYNGNTRFIKSLSGTQTTLFSAAFNATNDAYFRISESGGNILFDTSPDGNTWTNRFTGTLAFVITTEYIFIGSFKDGTVSQTTKFDNFNSNIKL